MEILGELDPLDNIIENELDSVYAHRYYRYCRRVGDENEFKVSDLFHPSPQAVRRNVDSHFSHKFIAHLPQHVFVRKMTDYLIDNEGGVVDYGYELQKLHQTGTGVTAQFINHNTQKLETDQFDFLVACDGYRSTCREQSRIEMTKENCKMDFLNIYFRSKGLARYLLKKKKNAMLHFIYNSDIASCLVNYSYKLGEFVLHLPLTSVEIEEYKQNPISNEKAKSFIYKSIVRGLDAQIDIINIGFWTLSGARADSFIDKRIILCGDSAHSLPPSGGFGMNLGIDDAHSLSHKLNLINIHNQQNNAEIIDKVLKGYNKERKVICDVFLKQSIDNFNTNLEVARDLGLDVNYLNTADTIVSALPFENKGWFMEKLKSVASFHLDSPISEKNIKDENLLPLNFFELETSQKIPLNDYIGSFTLLDSEYTRFGEYEGKLMPHFYFYIAEEDRNIGSRELYSYLRKTTEKGHSYIIFTNKADIAFPHSFVFYEDKNNSYSNSDGFRIESGTLKHMLQLNEKDYIIVLRSDNYIERIYVA